MLLIADSGSTKTDWIILNKGKQVFATSTAGLNPLFCSKEKIRTTLRGIGFLRESGKEIQKVKFFGAGCGSKKERDKIESSLQNFFRSAKVQVQTDLLGAALATCGRKKGIVCILGTGSNCCYYDGKKILQGNAGLGYILGDEASGSYFGKIILKKYLYGKLSTNMEVEFRSQFGYVSRSSVIENVYSKPNANKYLASFAEFLLKRKNSVIMGAWIDEALEEFYSTNIVGMKDYRMVPIHFVGSVAFFLNTDIKKMCERKSLSLGKIIQKPITGLADYYLKK
jgi:glucosamine kinase